MNEPHQRLKLAREHAGYRSAAAASRAFGWSVDTYKTHESGFRGIKADVAAAYARAFRVDAAWILFGRSPPAWLNTGPTPPLAVRTAMFPELNWPDVLEYVTAYPNVRHIMPVAERDIDSAANVAGGPVFFLRVRDRAMTSTAGGISFEPGDVIGCNAAAVPEPGDFVVALADGGAVPVVRRLQARTGPDGSTAYDLQPLNQDFPTLRISGSGTGRLVARVIAHTKHL